MKTMKWRFIVNCLINDGDCWDFIATREDLEISAEFNTAAKAAEAIQNKIEELQTNNKVPWIELVYADARTAILVYGGIQQDTPNLMYYVTPTMVEVPE